MASEESRLIKPGQFEPHEHWYPKALNATIHPLVNFFLHLKKERIVQRYCHLHPKVDKSYLKQMLDYRPKHFLWSGADLMHVTNEDGKRQMLVIENNSCPSGQKSMPLADDNQEEGGYRVLMERTVKPYHDSRKSLIEGGLAVIYDKNPMEASGYAAAMANSFKEVVHYTSWYNGSDANVRFEDGICLIRIGRSGWKPMRLVFRYLTQKPWNRLPILTKTQVVNPVIACLAGGRNKMLAAKAYDFLNTDLRQAGLEIITPTTIWDVSQEEIPLWIEKLGGQAVIKNPYSNAGQGVWTIVSSEELDSFMALDQTYDRFIVQSLIGNYRWSSHSDRGRFYHLGTVPNDRGHTFVADIRMMVSATQRGIRPICVYARRAASPLVDQLDPGVKSWDMLGTNLSFLDKEGKWQTETNRLVLTDRRDFNRLGLGLDDLIEGFIQTVLSTVAIDKLAQKLLNSKGGLKSRLFKSLDDDAALIREIIT
ncbi:MAG: hypothetical protein HKN76_22875 [Saprospiraceae bacterium]|nr:hypothetical protein [Saprospiraceae bacterium]